MAGWWWWWCCAGGNLWILVTLDFGWCSWSLEDELWWWWWWSPGEFLRNGSLKHILNVILSTPVVLFFYCKLLPTACQTQIDKFSVTWPAAAGEQFTRPPTSGYIIISLTSPQSGRGIRPGDLRWWWRWKVMQNLRSFSLISQDQDHLWNKQCVWSSKRQWVSSSRSWCRRWCRRRVNPPWYEQLQLKRQGRQSQGFNIDQNPVHLVSLQSSSCESGMMMTMKYLCGTWGASPSSHRIRTTPRTSNALEQQVTISLQLSKMMPKMMQLEG